jgi:hypothetical protein
MPDEKTKRSNPNEVIAEGGDAAQALTLNPASTERQIAVDGKLYTNISINFIQAAEPEVRLALKALADDLNRDGILGPVGIFITLGIVLVTVDFNSTRLGISSSVWEAVFILMTAASGIWSAIALIRRLRHGSSDRAIDRCLERIKGKGDGIKLVSDRRDDP